jgi:hypothetical protein
VTTIVECHRPEKSHLNCCFAWRFFQGDEDGFDVHAGCEDRLAESRPLRGVQLRRRCRGREPALVCGLATRNRSIRGPQDR